MDPADQMLLFRNATKQIFAREGYLASFMCRPHLPHAASSGWHLHHSIEDAATGRNRLSGPGGSVAPGAGWLGGLLRHAAAAAAFSTPTINGYKRYQPNSMAPDHVVWAYDNRAAMVRVIGQAGDPATHLENRVGEPGRKSRISTWRRRSPRAWMASRPTPIPVPRPTQPYRADAPRLPRTLMEAIAALRDNRLLPRRVRR